MTWFKYGQDQTEAILHATVRVLEAFFGDGTSSEAPWSVLEQQQHLLLTATADQILTQLVEDVEHGDNRLQQWGVEHIQFLCILLSRVRTVGLDVTREEFEAQLQMAQANPLHEGLIAWIGIAIPRAKRRFLETHRELLTPTNEQTLQEILTQETEESPEKEYFRSHLRVLRDARMRGGTTEAIHAAYVNEASGLILNIPLWLEELEQKIEHIADSNQHQQVLGQLQQAIAKAKSDPVSHLKYMQPCSTYQAQSCLDIWRVPVPLKHL